MPRQSPLMVTAGRAIPGRRVVPGVQTPRAVAEHTRPRRTPIPRGRAGVAACSLALSTWLGCGDAGLAGSQMVDEPVDEPRQTLDEAVRRQDTGTLATSGGGSSGRGAPDLDAAAPTPDARGLRGSEAGAQGDPAADARPRADDARDAAVGGRFAIVIAGFGGLLLLSKDGGKTWTKTGQDRDTTALDRYLYRSIAYGNGQWVVGGRNRMATSPDGAVWTVHDDATLDHVQGLAHGDGLFMASLHRGGAILRSRDGAIWERTGAAIPGRHLRVLHALGKFYAWSEESRVDVSEDQGKTWKVVPGLKTAAYCGGDTIKEADACYGQGVGHRGTWWNGTFARIVERQKVLELSTDGKSWKRVYTAEGVTLEVVGLGMVPE